MLIVIKYLIGSYSYNQFTYLIAAFNTNIEKIAQIKL